MNTTFFNPIIRGLSILLLGTLIACGTSSEDDGDTEDQSFVVETGVSKIRNVDQRLELTGNVRPFEQNQISPAMQQRINRIFVEVGDEVRKGEVLVRMDSSQLRQTRVQLENLKKEYARLDTLHKTGGVSQQQLDQIRTELDVTRSSYENLQENTQLVSPIDGVVTARNFEDGDMFAAGAGAILTVMQLNPVQVDVNVPESFFPSVHKEMPVKLQLDVYPDTTFTGEVHLKHPTVDPSTRTFTVETKFPNADKHIRPGMFGRINMVFETLERVTVPDLAIQRQQGTNDKFVFVVEDGKAVRKVVKTGRRIDDFYEITSGLSAGEEVITAGHSGLLDGTPVEVTD
ncbi:MAG: efflux RND transporter periplasmic adaptor subunit [Bacteroidota bacterium]